MHSGKMKGGSQILSCTRLNGCWTVHNKKMFTFIKKYKWNCCGIKISSDSVNIIYWSFIYQIVDKESDGVSSVFPFPMPSLPAIIKKHIVYKSFEWLNNYDYPNSLTRSSQQMRLLQSKLEVEAYNQVWDIAYRLLICSSVNPGSCLQASFDRPVLPQWL